MTDFTEHAREVTREKFAHWCITVECGNEIVEVVAAALTAAYEKGLEDAAEACDEVADAMFQSVDTRGRLAAEKCEVTIRALKEKP